MSQLRCVSVLPTSLPLFGSIVIGVLTLGSVLPARAQAPGATIGPSITLVVSASAAGTGPSGGTDLQADFAKMAKRRRLWTGWRPVGRWRL